MSGRVPDKLDEAKYRKGKLLRTLVIPCDSVKEIPHLNWALRYTESVSEPFVTSEGPFLAEMMPGVSEVDGLQHPDTLLYFPVCWQVCLFGSLRHFALGTDKTRVAWYEGCSQEVQVVRAGFSDLPHQAG